MLRGDLGDYAEPVIESQFRRLRLAAVYGYLNVIREEIAKVHS